jgi:iron(III) transport system ATP-binding protein
MTAVLSLQTVGKTFEPGVPVLQDISLRIEAGALVCLLGPSGCGKTTLLRLIAGFEEPDTGTIQLGGQPVSRPGHVMAPEKRRVGMVFQDYALFPHMTVSQNILFGLFRRPASHCKRRLAELLAMVDLTGMAERYPHELSGGQQQRVALARALAPGPQLLLLDEPFSNLDVNLRRQLRQEMQEVLRRTDMTTVLVTHDQEEALSLADTLAILDQGRVVQHDTPEAIVQRPCTRFVAEFLALGHFLRGEIRDDCIVTEMGTIRLGPDLPTASDDHRQVEVLIPPECVTLCDNGRGARARVVQVTFQGTRKLYTVRLPSGTHLQGFCAHDTPLQTGAQINVRYEPTVLITFPAKS